MQALLNLKVLVIESDFYARQTINSYLAWDRRTRVVAMVKTPEQAMDFFQRVAEIEWPDVIILEPEILTDAAALHDTISQFCQTVKDVTIICLARQANAEYAAAAADGGARAYLQRNEVRLYLVDAICYALDRRFVVTSGIRESASPTTEARLRDADVLPSEREYPEMTERIRQALWLCVVEGMPAQLAADEMGISPHTIRSYIKEGYRILEAHDDSNYPEEMGPLERAFMRFTALNKEAESGKKKKNPPG